MWFFALERQLNVYANNYEENSEFLNFLKDIKKLQLKSLSEKNLKTIKLIKEVFMEDKVCGCTIIVEDKMPGKFKEYGKFYFYVDTNEVLEGIVCVNGKTLFAKASYVKDENENITINRICATDGERALQIQLGDGSCVCNVATAQKEYDKVEIDARMEKLKGKESSIIKKNIAKSKQIVVDKDPRNVECLYAHLFGVRKAR